MYLRERMDIGLAYNAFTYVKYHYPSIWAGVEDRVTIVHFAGDTKPGGNKHCPEEIEALCVLWRKYRARVVRDIIQGENYV